jgi:hypothetical protein
MRWRRILETNTAVIAVTEMLTRLISMAFSLILYDFILHPNLLCLAAIVPAWQWCSTSSSRPTSTPLHLRINLRDLRAWRPCILSFPSTGWHCRGLEWVYKKQYKKEHDKSINRNEIELIHNSKKKKEYPWLRTFLIRRRTQLVTIKALLLLPCRRCSIDCLFFCRLFSRFMRFFSPGLLSSKFKSREGGVKYYLVTA